QPGRSAPTTTTSWVMGTSQELGTRPAAPRQRTHQPHLGQKPGQRSEARNLDFVAMRAAACGGAGSPSVKARAGIRNRIAEQVAEEITAQPVDVADEPPLRAAHVRCALAQAVARKLNMTGLFGDVNPHQALDDWL